jgi:uncharacterized protein (DUF1810 family)
LTSPELRAEQLRTGGQDTDLPQSLDSHDHIFSNLHFRLGLKSLGSLPPPKMFSKSPIAALSSALNWRYRLIGPSFCTRSHGRERILLAGAPNLAHPAARSSVAEGEAGMNDPYNLQRFVDAQEPVFEQVLSELRQGHKRTHWIWFIFPQIKGLGHSELARKFAISSREEAEAYLNHPVLGRRLKECTQLVTLVEGRSINRIFGSPDDMKFRSSMTLFANVASENPVFKEALQKYFQGNPDPLTLQRL